MDVVLLLGLAVLFGAGGWLLGVIGFFRANQALVELKRLRFELATPAIAVSPDAVAETGLSGEDDTVRDGLALEMPTSAGAAPTGEWPVAAAEDLPAAAVEMAPTPKRRDIEELLTLRWGMLVGAVSLLLAGAFLVRYAVDRGLLGPGPRCVLAALLGISLVIVAERLRRGRPDALPHLDLAPAALAAGGVGVLFAAAYGAGVLYQLVAAPAGFTLMAAAGLAGLVLSLRFGQLVAGVGIVGAFATPALVETTSPSLPGLFGYLLFVTAAALAVVRYTAWAWLGWATTSCGVAWVLFVMLGAPSSSWAPALFVPEAGLLNLALLPPAALDHPVGKRLSWIPFAALVGTGLFLAQSLPDAATRAAVLLMAPLAAGKAVIEPRLGRLPWFAVASFLLLLLGWGLPRPGDIIAGESIRETLSGAEGLYPVRFYLGIAALMAAFFAGCGLWRERFARDALSWSALVAAVPVLTLAVAYARVKEFEADAVWAGVAALLAGVLVVNTARAMEQGDRSRAGVHAAGTAAALALGCAMLLRQEWLTLAVALFVPALAWIDARVELPALRRVALAAAGLVLVRLLLNGYALHYADGQPPIVNGLVPAYLVPAASFAWASWAFRRRADDLLVAVLEGGSAAFVTFFIALEFRHLLTGGLPANPGFTFGEAAVQVAALAIQATVNLYLAQRTGRVVLGWVWRVQGGLALSGATLLLLGNPAFQDDPVGRLPVLNALLAAYAIPALLALAARRMKGPGLKQRRMLASYALVATFAWITLEIRHLFHPVTMGISKARVTDAELWAWSGAWLVFGLSLMAGGIHSGSRSMRLAALAIVSVATGKIFLVDMSSLVGLFRVLSFLGLGLTLIGLGVVYRRFVVEPKLAA